MQYQKNNKEQKDKRHKKARSPEYIIDSDLGEMNYAEPYGNQYISPMIMKGEQSIDANEHIPGVSQPSLQGTIVQIKNELKSRMGMAQLIKENPIESLEVNIPTIEPKSKSPKTINIGATKEEKTLNARKSPKNARIQQFQPSSDNLLGPEGYPQGEVQIQGLPDFRNQRQISFNPKGIILRSPNAPKRFKEFVYLPQERSEENIASPSNQMSPNINYEEMNNSGAGSRKGDEQEQNIQYNTTKNLIKSNTGNIFTSKPNQQIKQTSGRQKILTNLSASGNSIDDLPDKYKRALNNNMTMGEVKRIMRRFTKIYDPSKNNNGALLGSTQITVPGSQDELFNTRYRVLAKMNRLSNILLSNRNRSPLIGEDRRKTFLNKSRSRSISRESLDKSIKEKSVKKPRNKFLYVSLAMLSSKGPNTEDRVILRKMRMEKGGVVDLAQEQRKKTKYKIRQVFRNVKKTSYLHLNPKYREKAAKIIQDWWKELKVLNSDRLKKIILIQSVYRGKWVRKNMYDLLYLNYLYICFCKKIEKVLLSNLRPYVFGKLFYDEKHKKDVLINLIMKKDENVLRPYWIHWLKAIKSQYLINEASKKLIQIRANKENKLSILLAFFNKWKYICRIGVAPGDYDNLDYNQNFDNLYPSSKLNGLFNILDATNKYAKQKALDKILDKVFNYLTTKAKRNKLLKLLAKKPIYIKILLRKKLYFWYRQMVNSPHSFSSENILKVYEMKQKIFSLTITSTIKRLYRRIKRDYFHKLFATSIQKLAEKKYKTINDLIRQKLYNKEDFKEGEKETYEIDGKIYSIVKNKNDLIIIDNKGKQKTMENYKEKAKNKKLPYKKQHKLEVEKGDIPESGNEPYEESENEDELEEVYEKKDKKIRRNGKEGEEESLSKGEKAKRKTKIDSHESLTEGEEEPDNVEQGLVKKKIRQTSEKVNDKTEERKVKKGTSESNQESEEIGEEKTESIEESKIPKKRYQKGEEPKTKKGIKRKNVTKYEEEEEEDSERRPRFKSPLEKEKQKKSRPESEDEISTRHYKKPQKGKGDIIEEIITTKEGKKIIRKIKKELSSGEEDYTKKIIKEIDNEGNVIKRKIKIPKKKKPKDKKPKDMVEEEEEPIEEIDSKKGKQKKKAKKPKIRKVITEDGEEIEIEEEEPSEEIGDIFSVKRQKTLPKKNKNKKNLNKDGEIFEEEEQKEQKEEELQNEKPKEYIKPKTVDKKRRPKDDEDYDEINKTKVKKVPKKTTIKPKTQKIMTQDGKIVEILVKKGEKEPSEIIEYNKDGKGTSKKSAKKPKTISKDGKVVEVLNEESSDESYEEIEYIKEKPDIKKNKQQTKKTKKKIYKNKDGEEIEEELSQPSEEIYDDIQKRKSKTIPKKHKQKKYYNKYGEEIPKDEIEYHEKPSQEEPSGEEEFDERDIKQKSKSLTKQTKTKKYIKIPIEEEIVEELSDDLEEKDKNIKKKDKPIYKKPHSKKFINKRERLEEERNK